MKRIPSPRITLLQLAILVAFLGLWELSARLGWISHLFFPAPTAIGRNFFELLLSGQLLRDTAITLIRLGVGFTLGAIPALLIGWMMGWKPPFRKVFDPFVAALHPIPKVAVLPLILVIFGIGNLSQIVIIAIAAFFPLLISTVSGVRQINLIYFDTASNYGVGRWRTFRSVVIPGSLPSVLPGVRVAINAALVLTITSELLMAQDGLGRTIWFSWQTLQMEDLYVALCVTAVIGIGMNAGLDSLWRLLIPWQRAASA